MKEEINNTTLIVASGACTCANSNSKIFYKELIG